MKKDNIEELISHLEEILSEYADNDNYQTIIVPVTSRYIVNNHTEDRYYTTDVDSKMAKRGLKILKQIKKEILNERN